MSNVPPLPPQPTPPEIPVITLAPVQGGVMMGITFKLQQTQLIIPEDMIPKLIAGLQKQQKEIPLIVPATGVVK